MEICWPSCSGCQSSKANTACANASASSFVSDRRSTRPSLWTQVWGPKLADQTGRREVVRSVLRNVRFGSKADFAECETNVRFAPESGHLVERDVHFVPLTDSCTAAKRSIRSPCQRWSVASVAQWPRQAIDKAAPTGWKCFHLLAWRRGHLPKTPALKLFAPQYECDHGGRCNPVPHARFVVWQGFTPEKMPATSLPFLGQVPQNVWCTT